MDRIWLDSYPEGVPADIDANAYRNIGELFDEGVRKFSAQVAFICMGKAITYAELDRLSAAFAAYLQQVISLPPQSRVALMMPNVLQYPVAMFGALRAGYTIVNVNPLYTPRELEFQLTDSGAETIVVVENFAHTLEQVIERVPVKNVVVTSLGEMLGFPKGLIVDLVVRRVKKMVPGWNLPGAVRMRRAIELGASRPFKPVDVGHQDIAFLQYTGGTTGVAKGAVLTHRNIIANLQQAHAWIASHVEEGRELIITALPLYHIFSLTANCLTFFKLGAVNVLITNPRDIPGFVKELGKHRFTVMTGVNTLFNALMNNPQFAKLDFSSFKLSLGGGMAVQQAVAERWQSVTGRPLIEAYGLTETSPAVTINPMSISAFNHSIGLPVPSTVISVRDDEGVEVAIETPGELCIRGPQVMREYWNRPDETAKVFTRDGFLKTGDIVSVDRAGFVRLIDRKKDMILVSGFNVFPNEVEEVVASHPDVLEVAAVGVPDERTGEAVKLFVVRKDPSLSEASLIAHCRQSLSAYKVPHFIEFRDALPKTSVGKVLRRSLRETDD